MYQNIQYFNCFTFFVSVISIDYNRYFYYPTHTRFGPWLIGIVLGFVIFHVKKTQKPVKFSKPLLLVFWFLSLATLTTCAFCGHHLIDKEFNLYEHALYTTFVRPSWTVALAWVIFACTFGYGGPVSWFLSLPFFQVLSRFTFCMYVLHFTVLMVRFGSESTAHFFSEFTLVRILKKFEFWYL